MSSTEIQTTEKDNGEIDGKTKLRKWLNMNFRIEMTDGRVLIGVFLCTDRDANVILGACSEYLKSNDGETEEPRVLGLVMVPGRHIVSIKIDDTMDTTGQKYYYEE
ncbi:PREDICTED: N-alpha-acetyltransferase 38, NatC auxiliary subunit-like isoform X2 [Papilio polytes]|uniref:N-alpha-acetyltransferase 38, NatC auxiliary subunit-like isoform X2 n=1 Tax=Papilio polytes TaxID=76194 RepID=UPI0006760D0F|nr:PREDICTED: N-alpha-acetyltransferase 38, NatC auxiliary subunit-like isoform X2 [Papilio polytes]